MKASYKEFDAIVGLQIVHLMPGQFVFGLKKASIETGLTIREIRTILDCLKKAENLTIKTTNKFSIITVVNWPTYQGDETGNDTQNDKPLTNKGQHTNIKEVKNIKNPLDFSEEIFSLRKRYTDQSLIDQVLFAISSTRKSEKIADSVWVKILRTWERFPDTQVATALRTYLEKKYASEGKTENYLLGIIRNGGSGAGTPKTQRLELPPPAFEQVTCPNCGRKLAVKQDLLRDGDIDGCVFCLSVVKGGAS